MRSKTTSGASNLFAWPNTSLNRTAALLTAGADGHRPTSHPTGKRPAAPAFGRTRPPLSSRTLACFGLLERREG